MIRPTPVPPVSFMDSDVASPDVCPALSPIRTPLLESVFAEFGAGQLPVPSVTLSAVSDGILIA
jgi:hypothetical protein